MNQKNTNNLDNTFLTSFTDENERVFKNTEHFKRFHEFLAKSNRNGDVYHEALFYLLSLSDTLSNCINSLYDFDNHEIIIEGLYSGFQTGTSVKLTRLAFNLFNGFCGDVESSTVDCYLFTPYEIFCCDYQPYMLQAIKIRYPEYS